MPTLKFLAAAVAMGALAPAAAFAQQTTPSMESQTTPSMENTQDTMQDTMQDSMQGDTQQTAAAPSVLTEQAEDQILSDMYIGADVVARSADNLETVGQVSELLLDDQDKIVGVVVDVGGFLGVGAKPVGLAWSGLTEERSEGELLLKTSLTREDLESAPEFKTLEEKQTDQQMMEQEQTAPTTAQ